MDQDRITTARLVQELIDISDSRWGTYGRNDKPITVTQVTRLLKPYGIRSDSVRIPKDAEKTCKGYLRAWFEDAFTRYLPPLAEAESASDFSEARNPASEPGTPGTTLKTKDFSPKSNPEQGLSVPGSKPTQPVENVVCSGCSGFEGGFSGTGKTDAPDIPTDRTCVQCHGAIDGTERLVAVSGRAVWLHAPCERFWLRGLEERERRAASDFSR